MVIVVRLDILGSFPSFFKELLRPVPIIIRLRPSDSKNENHIWRFLLILCGQNFSIYEYRIYSHDIQSYLSWRLCLILYKFLFIFCRMIFWEDGVCLFWNYKLLSRVWAIFWKCSTIHFRKQFSYNRLAPFCSMILLNFLSMAKKLSETAICKMYKKMILIYNWTTWKFW